MQPKRTRVASLRMSGGDAAVIGVCVAGIALMIALLIWVLKVLVLDGRRAERSDKSAADRYRREAANLRPTPQTWRAGRQAARRAEYAKRRQRGWAAGAAGAAGAIGAYGIDG